MRKSNLVLWTIVACASFASVAEADPTRTPFYECYSNPTPGAGPAKLCYKVSDTTHSQTFYNTGCLEAKNQKELATCNPQSGRNPKDPTGGYLAIWKSTPPPGNYKLPSGQSVSESGYTNHPSSNNSGNDYGNLSQGSNPTPAGTGGGNPPSPSNTITDPQNAVSNPSATTAHSAPNLSGTESNPNSNQNSNYDQLAQKNSDAALSDSNVAVKKNPGGNSGYQCSVQDAPPGRTCVDQNNKAVTLECAPYSITSTTGQCINKSKGKEVYISNVPMGGHIFGEKTLDGKGLNGSGVALNNQSGIPGNVAAAPTKAGPDNFDLSDPLHANEMEGSKYTKYKEEGELSNETRKADLAKKQIGGKTGNARFKLDEDHGLNAVNHDDGTDPCAVSDKLTEGDVTNMKCSNTRAFVSGVDSGKEVAQMVGTAVLSNVGKQGAQQAAQQQTQSSAYQAQADSTKTAGQLHLGIGAIAMITGWMERQKGVQHDKNAERIKTEISNGKDLSLTAPGGNASDDGRTESSNMYVGRAADKKDLLHNAMNNFGGDLNDGMIAKDENYRMVNKNLIKKRDSFQQTDPNYANYNNLLANQNQQRENEANFRLHDMRNEVTRIQNQAVKEQNNEGTSTKDAAMQTLVLGAGQMFLGANELKTAAQIRAAANTLQNGPSIAAPGSDPFAAPTNGANTPAITGAATANPTAAAADGSSTPSGGGKLGTGFAPKLPSDLANAPPKGTFTRDSNSAPPGGSGAGGGGGGPVSLPPATADNSEQGAKQLPGDNTRYESGGYGGGGGGGGRGAGNDKGPDLSGLLAQFLPKKEEDFGNAKVLEFGGGRNPAAEEPISLLDRNTNIFERVHETYQEKNRRGKIGIF